MLYTRATRPVLGSYPGNVNVNYLLDHSNIGMDL